MSRFRYTIHNVVGHPLMEIFALLGMHKRAAWIHDVTLPSNWQRDDVGEQSDV